MNKTARARFEPGDFARYRCAACKLLMLGEHIGLYEGTTEDGGTITNWLCTQNCGPVAEAHPRIQARRLDAPHTQKGE